MTTPRIKLFVLGMYETNCFVVTVPGEQACWIVDCGFDPEPMLDWIAGEQLQPAALLLTHTHPDHIAGVDVAVSRKNPSCSRRFGSANAEVGPDSDAVPLSASPSAAKPSL